MMKLLRKLEKLLIRIGLKFDDSELEIEYHQRQMKLQRAALLYENIAGFVWCIVGITEGYYYNDSTGYMTYRFVLPSIFLICLLLYKKFPILHELLLIPSSLSLNAYYFFRLLNLDQNLSTIYTIGNTWGSIEIYLLLIVKRNWLKSVITIYFVFSKWIFMGYTNGVFVSVALYFFAIYRDVKMRRDFSELVNSRDKAKKFEYLLSEYFPTNVVIIKDDFTNFLYKNTHFKESFEKNQELKHEIFNELENNIKLFEKASSEPSDALSEVTINASSGSKTFEKSTKKCFPPINIQLEYTIKNFHVKMKKILWDNQPSFAMVLNDLSEKHTLETLQRVNEYKDRVIASISHELRTPINGILGMIEAITDQNVNKKLVPYLDNCRSCARLLLHFVNSILDLHQIRAEKITLNRKYFSLKSITQELISIYSYQATMKNIEFKIEIGNDVAMEIYTDRLRLLQVLINLITNAFKFTRKGEVTLYIKRDLQKRKKLEFIVKDTGIGITPENQQKLFRLFEKIEQEDKNINSQGVGLGLNISNEIIKMLNDDPFETIKVESTIGKGSSFKFSLECLLYNSVKEIVFDEAAFYQGDISEEVVIIDTRPTDKIQKNFASFAFGTIENSNMEQKDLIKEMSLKKCLVVDDNSFNLMAISNQLEKLNILVKTALSGEQAIEILEKEDFNIVLMDIQMPVLNGIETTKLIIKKIEMGVIKQVPILALTANGQSSENIYEEAGMVDFMQKPISNNELKEKMEKWINSD